MLDSSTVVSAIGWRHDSHRVLRLLAARGFESCRTPRLTEEWTEAVERVAENEPRWKNANWPNWLVWLKAASKLFDEFFLNVVCYCQGDLLLNYRVDKCFEDC